MYAVKKKKRYVELNNNPKYFFFNSKRNEDILPMRLSYLYEAVS